jgi:hypothetical protein
MTDRQIIIDGIDVSKCIYFQQEDDEYTCGAEECNGAIVACRACDNCYYKQLKRKEQKFDKSKLLLQTIIETNKIYPLQNNLLKLLDILEENENE